MGNKEHTMGMVIGIVGHDRCGKDTIARLLSSAINTTTEHSADILHFSTPLKDVCARMLHISIDELEAKKNSDELININNEYITYRDYIILTAKSVTKAIGKYTFTDITVKKIFREDANVIIMSDLRFKHEYKKLSKKFNLVTIQIESDLEGCVGTNKYDVDKIPCDYIIRNVKDNIEIAKRDILEIVRDVLG